jgi:hypothetical protein
MQQYVPPVAEALVNIDHIQKINELAGGRYRTTLLALLHVELEFHAPEHRL